MKKEFDFTDPKCNETLTGALTWYSQNFSYTESKKWALDWLAKNDPEQAKRLAGVKETKFSNRGFVCRIIQRGFNVEGSNIIPNLLNFFKEMQTEEKIIEKIEKPTKKTELLNKIIFQLEDVIDDILSDNEPVAVTIPIDPKQIEEAKIWIEKELIETSEMIAKHQAIFENLENIYTRCGGIANSIKKPKVSQTPIPTKAVAAQAAKTVTCLKEDKVSGLLGLSPAKIVGANRAFLYQTQYKVGMVFVAKPGEKLTISGSSVRGFDPEKSFNRTIRNPREFFKSPNLFIEIENMRTKKYPITSHISKTTIIANAE